MERFQTRLGQNSAAGYPYKPQPENAAVPRITKVYTRTGDNGQTCLGTGERIDKTARRVDAMGAVDEVNAAVGMALCHTMHDDVRAALVDIQNTLFHMGADLCVPEQAKAEYEVPRIQPVHVERLEALMDKLSASLSPLENFVLPGGTPAAAGLHFARTICRRAERTVLRLHVEEPVSEALRAYINRLSDTLFVMARYDNQAAGQTDVVWDSRRT